MTIGGNKSTRAAFFAEMKRRCKSFVLEVESVSSQSAAYLDLWVFGPRYQANRCLDFGGYTKQSSIWQPLSPFSCHSRSVLETWPLQEVRRRQARCLSRRDAVQYANEFICKYGALFGTKVDTTQHSSISFPKNLPVYLKHWGRHTLLHIHVRSQ